MQKYLPPIELSHLFTVYMNVCQKYIPGSIHSGVGMELFKLKWIHKWPLNHFCSSVNVVNWSGLGAASGFHAFLYSAHFACMHDILFLWIKLATLQGLLHSQKKNRILVRLHDQGAILYIDSNKTVLQCSLGLYHSGLADHPKTKIWLAMK